MTQAQAIARRRVKQGLPPITAQQPAIVVPPRTLPAVRSLAVVTAYFNPQRSWQRLANLQRFVDDLHGIPVYVVEGRSPDADPLTLPSATIWSVPCRDVLWQKERLLNWAIERLPPDVDAVGWWDADVLFDRSDLAAAILDGLARWPVLQPWSECVMLREDGSLQPWFHGRQSIMSMAALNRGQPGNADCAIKHPGFAWCIRRDVLTAIGGLYEHFITGSGDTVMAMAFYGDFQSRFMRYDRMSAASLIHWRTWADRAYAAVQGRVGCVPGTIRHLYHGEIERRMYNTRWSTLARNSYDPARHVTTDGSGALAWTPDAPPTLVEYVRQYLLYDRGEQ